MNDTVRAVPYRKIDNIAPAGSINSNAVDMAQWVRLHLGDGKFAGKQLISKRMVDEMHSAQTVIKLDPNWSAMNPSAHLMAYGLGWFLSDYEGKYLVQHGGNIDGMTALVAMLPEEHFGIVILSNMNGSQLPTARHAPRARHAAQAAGARLERSDARADRLAHGAGARSAGTDGPRACLTRNRRSRSPSTWARTRTAPTGS